MLLKDLLPGNSVKQIFGPCEVKIQGISYSSFNIKPGYLFAAIPGYKTNGHYFIEEAIKKGAAVILFEDLSFLREGMKNLSTFIQVENSRETFAHIACRYYGKPSHTMEIIGVTGTNGKTTTSFLIRTLMEFLGPTGLIGTIGYWIGKEKQPSLYTTPESSDLQSYFKQMKNKGIKNVVMEVSSHALALDRTLGTCFDIAVFTNLTRDHLDFHQTMENYFQVKSKLFRNLYDSIQQNKKPLALINIDDPWGNQLKSLTPSEVWTYGLSKNADLQARNIRQSSTGTTFQMFTPAGQLNIHSPLLGAFNVYNLMAAVGVGIRHSIPLLKIEELLEKTDFIPGRLEKVADNYPFSVFVDYAHTEDALFKILSTLEEIKERQIILVFGCGGDRDKGKRAKMGEVAGRLADQIIITSDNPRNEDPMEIVKQIEEGILGLEEKRRGRYQVIVDRKDAIEAAIREAKPKDLILIAGKGHEDYQTIGESKFEFNDRNIARKALQKWFGF